MLQSINEHMITWQCPGSEDNACGIENSGSISDVVYQHHTISMSDNALSQESHLQSGVVLALPCCLCGIQTFLKADYTVRELFKLTQTVINEQREIWAYALPLRHVRTLYLHWLLWQQGRAPCMPIIPMPREEILSHPRVQSFDLEIVLSLWFGYASVRQFEPALPYSSPFLLE